jgi:hypothetical protein
MFGFLKKKRAVVQHQWMVPLENFRSDVGQFYGAIEETIHERDLPPMQIMLMDWREGGLLSSGRQYLRIMRERLVFDIGAGPFGKYWFFSCRGAVVPRWLTWMDVVFALLTCGSFYMIYQMAFGWALGLIVMGATVAAIFALMITAGRWPGLDEALIHMPVVGVIYEALFRRDTYFRQDTRLMWLNVINSIVREKVQEFARLGGVEEVHFEEVHDPAQPEGIRDLAGKLLREFAADMSTLKDAVMEPSSAPAKSSKSHH